MQRVNIIQRAFEIAAECVSLEDVRKRLSNEGYAQAEAHLSGPQIRREIATMLKHGPAHFRKR